jgi:predicted DNA-binding transcriptional regulator AlpA
MNDLRISKFDDLPDSALISAKEIMTLTGRSRTSLWRDVLHGNLADPVLLGNRTVKWRASDVRQFLKGFLGDGD